MKDDQVQYILADLIDLPEKQMRREINRDELHDLAENIKANGLINPIMVRPVGDRFELVAGQRRLLACGIARIVRIPCIVRDLSDASAMNVMAAENLERRDVDLVDEANFIALVMKEQEQSISQMAERLNRGEQYVKDRLAVAAMPDYMQGFLKTGEMKLGVALALLEIEPDEKRRVWVGMAIEGNITTRVADHWAYQHRLGTLPEVIHNQSEVPGAPIGERSVVMFECALDGKHYPASQCQSVFVYNGNLPFFNEFRKVLSIPPAESESGTDRSESPAPVGAGSS